MKKNETLEVISSTPVQFTSLAALKDYLTRKGIDWESWKSRKTKTVGELFALIENRTAEIHESEDRPVLVLIDVGIDVVCRFSDDAINIVVEKKREFIDEDEPEERMTRHSLTAKVSADRSTAETAWEKIVKVLKYKKSSFAAVVRIPGTPYFDVARYYHHSRSAYKNHLLLIEIEPCELNTNEDAIESFPGLTHRRARKVVLCIVPKSAYKHRYTNTHRGKKSVFESILLRDLRRYDPHYTMNKYQPLREAPSRKWRTPDL